MTRKQGLYLGLVAIAVLLAWAGSVATLGAQQAGSGAVRIDGDDIGGVVTGPGGPEAGVWVIAETTELPTRFARIVVTDDQGRYVVPDLPKAKYKVWVRGYGLVDSAKIDAEPARVPWELATRFVADRLREIAAAHGADAIAFYGSGQLLTDALQKDLGW